jgi:nitrate/nitrite transporter NarK
VGHPQDSQKRHLLLGTVSFTVCFAVWGLISAFAPHFRQQFHLSATQTAFLVAVPVLLGALARIPIGMLVDRFGGRVVFTVLMFFVAVPVALVPAARAPNSTLFVAPHAPNASRRLSGRIRQSCWRSYAPMSQPAESSLSGRGIPR